MSPGLLLRRRRTTAAAVMAVCLTQALVASAAPSAVDPSGGALVAPAPPAAHLPPPPGTTSRVSVSTAGVEGLALSGDAATSGDGRWVAFVSLAGNLVPGDTNGAPEVFLRDLANGTTERLPVIGGGFVEPRASATEPAISEDGRFVAFRYDPPAPVGTSDGPTPNRILLWERGKGTIEVAPPGLAATSQIRREPSIAPDASWVAFTVETFRFSGALPSQIFAWNRGTNEMVLVSAAVGRGAGNASSSRPSVSGGGAFIAFQSPASSLVRNDVNPGTDVFVRDMSAATTSLVTAFSLSPGQEFLPSQQSEEPAISGDGRYVAFTTTAQLSDKDANPDRDVYRWDRETGAFELVSVGKDGVATIGASGQPAISADGRYVAFASTAGDVVPVAAPAGPATQPPVQLAALIRSPSEIYLRDMSVPESIRVSLTIDGASAGRALRPSVSDTGSRVAFDSDGPNLVRNDTNQAIDVFLRDLPALPTVAPNPVEFGGQPVGVEGPASAVTIGNDGWADLRILGLAIAGEHAADFTVVVDPCSDTILRRGQKCTISLMYRPTGAGTRTAELRITDSAAGSPRPVRLIGSATDAKLEVEPRLGAPGRVVVATGTGFPPGAPVRLSWDRGITPALPPIVADDAGTFKVQVLVFHKDVSGRRLLRAEATGTPSFPPVDAEYTVVRSLAQPLSYSNPFQLGPGPIIIRR